MSGLVFIILIWTIAMNHFQIVLSSFMSLLCRKFPPLDCFFIVLRNPMSFVIHLSQTALSISIFLFYRKTIPLLNLFVVLWNPFCWNIKVNYLSFVIFKIKNLLTINFSKFFFKLYYPQLIHYKKNLITFFKIKIFFIYNLSPKNIFYSQFTPIKAIFL